ncbi:winged helix-turn-helix transcriptional regulator [Halioxenophilus sp. WMMB6]|uniref:winged helix-turn-helix transcriptional regulator n=1 Tax=Halioxenophilus sp. WMMB6 TaxID=3073815 RepID=UPI00295ED812|nr:winged helix-turn-helix transcriptional regulator [Halioxenophilus sp. WMMB6]
MPTSNHKKPLRNLDRTDRRILKVLQSDGRTSNIELSKRINLSASSCLERVKRLESEGFITGYYAKLNADYLGQHTVAFVEVTLNRSSSQVFDDFRDAIRELHQVAECHMLAGGFDYLVKLRFPQSESYREVLGKLVDLPGVAQTHTYMVIEQVKEDQGIHFSVD